MLTYKLYSLKAKELKNLKTQELKLKNSNK